MSAYICSASHIAALAAYAARNEAVLYEHQVNGNNMQAARNTAELLARANVHSVAGHYGADEIPSFLPDGVTLEDFYRQCADRAEHYVLHPPKLGNVDILKMAHCLDYQSCEIDGWEKTLAFRQLERIKYAAVSSLPGYDDAPWGWEDAA